MDNGQKWFFTALVAGAGSYLLVDANESVRSMIAVIAFCVFYLIGESEMGKEALRDRNNRLWDEIETLKAKIDALELDRDR